MLNMYDVVQLKRTLPSHNLPIGTRGTILSISAISDQPTTYQIEFADGMGKVLALVALEARDLQKVWPPDEDNTRQRNEAELVKRHFQYLFAEYGFRFFEVRYFDSFSNWAAVLVSTKFRYRVRFFEDRGYVTLDVGPLWDPPDWEAGPWFGLPVVTAYLNEGEFKWNYDKSDRTEPQLQRLTGILRPYMDRICTLFSPDNFPKHEYKPLCANIG